MSNRVIDERVPIEAVYIKILERNLSFIPILSDP